MKNVVNDVDTSECAKNTAVTSFLLELAERFHSRMFDENRALHLILSGNEKTVATFQVLYEIALRNVQSRNYHRAARYLFAMEKLSR
jgi:hypothetical protein